jgi:AGCS family alanine or glycine:cation symporter
MSVLNILPLMVGGVGIYLLAKLRFFFLAHPIRTAREIASALGDRDSRRSLALALAGTLGVGNIFGVAAGLMIGGAGSLFWIMVSSLFAMVIKYAETLLAFDIKGGRGFSDLLRQPFSTIYTILIVLLSLFMGSALQSAAVLDVAECGLGMRPLFSGVILLILLLPCLVRGVEKIEKITEIIIPLTTIIYIIMCLCVIFMNLERFFVVISDIISSVFSPSSVVGGIVPIALREGFSRGILSNEAGIGSSAMAHLRGGKRTPHVAGLFGILEVFFDTTLLCSLTGLAILMSGVSISAFPTPMSLVTAAFVRSLGDFSGYLLTFLILSFAYATIICWYFYGSEICRHRGFAFVFVIFLLLPMVARMDFIIYSTDLIILFMANIVLSRIIKGRDRIALLSHECLNKSDS